MKIGSFAKKYNTNISTIRYYMGRELLFPQKKGGQYDFTDSDCADMELILELKSMGFHFNELQKYINLIRLYDENDLILYDKLHEILSLKYKELELEKLELEKRMTFVSEKSAALSQFRQQDSSENTVPDATCGVPLECIPFMQCPVCHTPLSLENVSIHNNRVNNGSLICSCGYTATISNGIIFSGDFSFDDTDMDFFNLYYGENPLIQEYDSVFFECVDECNPEFITAIHKTKIRMNNIIENLTDNFSCVLFPEISSHFLYSYHSAPYLKDALIIVTALTEGAVFAMRKRLSSVTEDLNIVYIVNQDGNLPLKGGCIDLVVDYFGINNLSFFSKTPYLDSINPYFTDDCTIIGTTDYYRPNAKSLKNIQKLYKNASPNCMKLQPLKESLAKCNFHIAHSETYDKSFDPGKYFEYHQHGEVRGNLLFYAKRNSK